MRTGRARTDGSPALQTAARGPINMPSWQVRRAAAWRSRCTRRMPEMTSSRRSSASRIWRCFAESSPASALGRPVFRSSMSRRQEWCSQRRSVTVRSCKGAAERCCGAFGPDAGTTTARSRLRSPRSFASLDWRLRSPLEYHLPYADLSLTPAIERLDFQDGDVIAICSDGVTDVVRELEILHALAPDDLISLARERGSRDDATCVLGR